MYRYLIVFPSFIVSIVHKCPLITILIHHLLFKFACRQIDVFLLLIPLSGFFFHGSRSPFPGTARTPQMRLTLETRAYWKTCKVIT